MRSLVSCIPGFPPSLSCSYGDRTSTPSDSLWISTTHSSRGVWFNPGRGWCPNKDLLTRRILTCDRLFLRNRNDTLFSACPDAHLQITLVGLGEGERGSCGVSFKGLLFKWLPEGGQSASADRGWHQELVFVHGGWQTLSHALRLALNKTSGREPWQESARLFYCVIYFMCWK